ncbi:MAG TPA: GntG family PLP-dependent aldolase [Bryobacteraceae bacterium]|jgi:threonine aldolase
MIDLRSDTVTKPTPEMRRAMAEAEVGDDVYGEDPTVNLLERRAAEIMGKPAALFVPTGSMGNLIAIKLHTRPGDEVVCDHHAHVVDWELASHSWFSGCLLRTVHSEDGLPRWRDLEPALRPPDSFCSRTAAIHLENTHNMAGGTVYPIEELDYICDRAHERGLKAHIDGARIFNAAEASGVPAARIASKADTVMFCLSKGLGAPVGSILAGPGEDIARARILRKQLGGGMRQAGVLAAAGLIALEQMPSRLAEDHANARLLAEGVAELPGIAIDPAKVVTNIVIFDIEGARMPPGDFVAAAKSRGVLLAGVGGTRVRVVTHYDVTREDCLEALRAIKASLAY